MPLFANMLLTCGRRLSQTTTSVTLACQPWAVRVCVCVCVCVLTGACRAARVGRRRRRNRLCTPEGPPDEGEPRKEAQRAKRHPSGIRTGVGTGVGGFGQGLGQGLKDSDKGWDR
eukprot:126092-Prorocentrum_minimum.AAC.1